jgi:hypothetical protein
MYLLSVLLFDSETEASMFFQNTRLHGTTSQRIVLFMYWNCWKTKHNFKCLAQCVYCCYIFVKS